MKKLKVLIAGAEPVCDLKIAAHQWGCEVIVAADGKQACAALLAGHVDLCILDWDLPKMTGLAACHWIRSVELKRQPYVVLLVEKNRPEQIQAAYLAGANDFIAQPFKLEDLRFLILGFAQQDFSARGPVSRSDQHGPAGTLSTRLDCRKNLLTTIERNSHLWPLRFYSFRYPLNPNSTRALRSFSRHRPRINPIDPVASPSRLPTSA